MHTIQSKRSYIIEKSKEISIKSTRLAHTLITKTTKKHNNHKQPLARVVRNPNYSIDIDSSTPELKSKILYLIIIKLDMWIGATINQLDVFFVTRNMMKLVVIVQNINFRLIAKIYARGMPTQKQLDANELLISTFKNGIIERFCNSAEVIKYDFMSNQNLKVAKALARYHIKINTLQSSTNNNTTTSVSIWDTMEDCFWKAESCAKYMSVNIDFSLLKEVYEKVKSILIYTTTPIINCHNNITHQNILCNNLTNELTFVSNRIGYNYLCMDISSYFCSLMVADHTLVLNKDMYPTEQEQYEFLALYSSKNHIMFNTIELKTMFVNTNKFSLIVNLKRGLELIYQSQFQLQREDQLAYYDLGVELIKLFVDWKSRIIK